MQNDPRDAVSTRALIIGGLAAAIRPPPRVDPVAWGEKNVKLVAGPRAGTAWNSGFTPFWREPMRCMAVDAPDNRGFIRKSTQVGFTQALLVLMGYLIDTAPASMMLTQPTGSDVKDFNAEQLAPTIAESPVLKRKVREQKSRDNDGSTSHRKRFPGGYLVLVGAHASAGLRRRTIKYMLNDEVDDYPLDLDEQGDPMEMIAARQTAFLASGDYKQLVGSTPTVDGMSRIDQGFEAGDQRYYQVPCPHCRHLHKLDFWRLKYAPAWPHQAHYHCEACGAEIAHHHKTWMLAEENGAKWVPENPGARFKSWHIEAIYSPMVGWDDVVAKYLECKDDPLKMKGFTNLWLGRAFKVKGEAPEAQLLYDRRSDYAPGILPPGVLFLTCGVDVQQNRLEWEVAGWGVGKTSWSVARGIIEGDTITPDPWVKLSELYRQEWRDWQGNVRGIERLAVDAGFRPQMVYQWVRGKNRAFAIKGVAGHLAPVLGTPTAQDVNPDGRKRVGSVMLWPLGVWQLKAELYGFLNLKVTEAGGFPPGWCHFPRGDLYDLDFFQQLTAEKLIDVQRRGYIDRMWVKDRRFRNEALDCRVYATAAAYHAGMGQWTPQYWAQLAAERGAPPEQGQLDLLATAMLAKPPAQNASASDAQASPASPPARQNAAPAANGVRGEGRKFGGTGRTLN